MRSHFYTLIDLSLGYSFVPFEAYVPLFASPKFERQTSTKYERQISTKFERQKHVIQDTDKTAKQNSPYYYDIPKTINI